MEPLCECEQQTDFLDIPYQDGRATPRRTSAASSVSGYCSEGADRDRSMSGDSSQLRFNRLPSRRICHQQPPSTGKLLAGYKEQMENRFAFPEQQSLGYIPEQGTGPVIVHAEGQNESDDVPTKKSEPQDDAFLAIPRNIATSNSSDTIIGEILEFLANLIK